MTGIRSNQLSYQSSDHKVLDTELLAIAGRRGGKTSDRQRSAARADLGPGLGHLTPPSGRTENRQGILLLISLIT